MERAFVDTNVLVRFLTGDPPDLAERARSLFDAVDAGQVQLVLEEVILAEVVWVLESYYRHPPAEIARILLDLLAHEGIDCRDKGRLARALVLYVDRGVDFADALLATAVQAAGEQVVYSFDRHFDRLPGITRCEPGEGTRVS